LRKAGQRIKSVKKAVAARRAELEEKLRPEILTQLDRMVMVQKWLDDSMPQEHDGNDDDDGEDDN